MVALSVIEIVSTVLVCVAVPLIAVPRIEGFYVLSVAQVGWSIFAYFNNQYFFLGQSLFLLVFNIVGIYSWRKKKVGLRGGK